MSDATPMIPAVTLSDKHSAETPSISFYDRTQEFFQWMFTGSPSAAPTSAAEVDKDVEAVVEEKRLMEIVAIPINNNPDLKRPKNNLVFTIFLILNTMIGSGVFAMPFVFRSCGVVTATFMILITTILTCVGMVSAV